jgi:hypothetical protein
MNGADLVCRGRGDCLNPIAIACNCGIPIVFLCKECISRHVLNPGNHRLVHLKQVQQYLSTSSSSDHYEESQIRYLKIKSKILEYINSLKEFKAKITVFRFEIINQIERIIESKVEQIDSVIDQSYIKLYDLNKEAENRILIKYEETGLDGFIDNYIYNMNLNIEDVNRTLISMITLETRNSPQDKREIVLPIHVQEVKELKELIQVQALHSDELENELRQLQEGYIAYLTDRSRIQDESIMQLHQYIRDLNDSLKVMKSCPNNAIQLTNRTLESIQKHFNNKCANMETDIGEIKQLTIKLQQSQAKQGLEHADAGQDFKELSLPLFIEFKDVKGSKAVDDWEFEELKEPHPFEVRECDEVERPQYFKVPEIEEINLPEVINNLGIDGEVRLKSHVNHKNAIFTLKNGTKKLIKYDSDTNTITKYLLNGLSYELYFAATCRISDEGILIAGGR